MRSGSQVLRKWVGVWNQGTMQPSTTDLWTAGAVTPVDCGSRPGTPTGRKLRPITLAEHVVKLAESVGIDANAMQRV